MSQHQFPTELNFVKIMEDHLESFIKTELIKSLTKKAMESIEKEVREDITKLVDGFTVDAVDRLRNMMSLREEVYVYIKHKKDEVTTENTYVSGEKTS